MSFVKHQLWTLFFSSFREKNHPHVTEKKTGLVKRSQGPGVKGHGHTWTESRCLSDRGAHLGVRVGNVIFHQPCILHMAELKTPVRTFLF